MKQTHREIIRSTLIGLGSLALLVLAFKSIDYFFPGLYAGIQKFVAGYGLFGVFIGVFVGSTLLPFPTDAFFISTVSLSHDTFAVAAVGIIAAFLATLLNYFLALWFSQAFVEKMLGKKQVCDAKAWMDSYGFAAVFAFGVLPVSPFFDTMTFVAGLSEMDFKKFALVSLASRIIHYGGLALLASKLLG